MLQKIAEKPLQDLGSIDCPLCGQTAGTVDRLHNHLAESRHLTVARSLSVDLLQHMPF